MLAEKEIQFGKEQLILTNKRAVFLEKTETLIISDLHLGKTTHFRKNGIAIPSSVVLHDLERLEHLISYFKPTQIIVAGDFFHASENKELEIFRNWRRNFENICFILVKGNHDKLPESTYQNLNIDLYTPSYTLNGLNIVHHPDKENLKYHICGHIHPGIVLKGIGKQRLRLPCYIVTENRLILPAFSEFTGLDSSYSNDAIIYAFTNDAILEV